MPVAKPRNPLVLGGRVVDGGILHLDNRAQLDRALKHPSWQRRVTITIAPEEEKRRIRQNKFYWKVLDTVAKFEIEEGVGRGWNKDQFHIHFALAYNSEVFSDIDLATGEVREARVGKSTAKLTVAEFSDYLENVLNEIAQDYGLVIEPTRAEDWRAEQAA
jgi:hypothetical protein